MKSALTIALKILLTGLVVLSFNVVAQVKVEGYYRSDGTYVKPHYRSNPDGKKNNNWTTEGNVNPYTGVEGYLPRDPSESEISNTSAPTYNYGYRAYSAEDSDQNLSLTCFTVEDSICLRDAPKFIGEIKTVCDKIADVHRFSKGHYLNLGAPFPKQLLTIVVWDNSANWQTGHLSGGIDALPGQYICVEGKISTYRGRLDITPAKPIRVVSGE